MGRSEQVKMDTVTPSEKEIIFRERSRFRSWEMKRLWVLCGLEPMHVYSFMDAVMRNMEPPQHYIPQEQEQETWSAFV